jgi:alpha-1,3-rhamnosyl/mannosyltransferase
MHVLYDASTVLGHSGIERYSRELIAGLLRQCPDIDPVLLSTFRRRDEVQALFRGTRAPEVIPALPNMLMLGAQLQWVTRLMKRRTIARYSKRFDLTHVLSPVEDPRALSRFVVSVHDLFPLDASLEYGGSFRSVFSRSIGQYMSHARLILVQSDYVANSILERFPTVASRIRRIPSAASPRFRVEDTDATMLADLGVSTQRRPFVFVGRVDARKNIPSILRAFSALPHHVREEHPLVLVLSGTTEDVEAFRRTYDTDIRHADATILLAISTAALVQLLNVAHAMVFPSIAEGFGLPVLEAMQCGCPVITSDRSSMPEVAGDAALLVDPTSVDAIAAAMQTLGTDNTLREQLATSGLRRAQEFTWDRSAELTAIAYREACEG